ncbi:MAG: hypothetical protein SGARI_002927 [Bacillariaceae sp.]
MNTGSNDSIVTSGDDNSMNKGSVKDSIVVSATSGNNSMKKGSVKSDDDSIIGSATIVACKQDSLEENDLTSEQCIAELQQRLLAVTARNEFLETKWAEADAELTATKEALKASRAKKDRKQLRAEKLAAKQAAKEKEKAAVKDTVVEETEINLVVAKQDESGDVQLQSILEESKEKDLKIRDLEERVQVLEPYENDQKTLMELLLKLTLREMVVGSDKWFAKGASLRLAKELKHKFLWEFEEANYAAVQSVDLQPYLKLSTGLLFANVKLLAKKNAKLKGNGNGSAHTIYGQVVLQAYKRLEEGYMAVADGIHMSELQRKNLLENIAFRLKLIKNEYQNVFPLTASY